MFYVKHFVVHDVLSKPLGYLGGVKRFADGDRLVDPIVVPEYPLGAPLRPGERGRGQFTLKITTIQSSKHAFQIVNTTLR